MNSTTPTVIPPGPGTVQVGIMYPYGTTDWQNNLYRGCNSRYAMSGSNIYDNTAGMAYPVPDTGTYGITVEKGHTIQYEVFPATGFKVQMFHDFNDQNLSYQPTRGATYTRSNIQDSLVLCPNFVPLNPTYNRNITVNVRGAVLYNAVEITSMLGYYDYNINSSVSGTQRIFNPNGLSPSVKPYEFEYDILPDNNTLYIDVKKKTGYTAKLFVDGVEQTPLDELAFQEEQQTGLTSQGRSGSRSGTSYTEPSITLMTEPHNSYRIPNTGAGKCVIDVVYTENVTPEIYRVEVTADGGGTVQVYDEGSVLTASTQINVEEGHNVVLKATPNTDYEFLMWKEQYTGWTSNRATDTYEDVQQNLVFVAYFIRSSTTISVQYDPSSGIYGTASIRVNGSPVASRTINSRDYSDTDTIELVATPAASTSLVEYRFVRWTCLSSSARHDSEEPGRSLPNYNETDPVITVGFDSVKDLVFTAHFASIESGKLNFNAHTVTGTNGSFTDGPEQPLFLGVKYQNQNGSIVTEEFDSTGGTFTAKLTNNGDTLSTTVVLAHTGDGAGNYIHVDSATGRKYLCHFEGYYYRELVSSSQHPNWELITPVNDTWTWSIGYGTPANRLPTVELVAAYTVQPIFTVKIAAMSERGLLPTNYVDFSVQKNSQPYTGDIFTTGDIVDITASVASGVSQYFTFSKWTRDGEDLQGSGPHCQITVGETDTTVVAVYEEKCSITTVASPSNAGTTKVNGQTGTVLVDYGDTAVLTATAASGYSFSEWRKGGVTVSSEETYTINSVTNVSPVTYTARFIQSSKKLRVMNSDGGSVQIEIQESGSSDWAEPQPTSVTSSYREYTIETGSRIRATAVPEPSHTFEGYVLYDTQNQQNQVENASRVFIIDNLNVDKTLVPSFRYIPWISTLSAIIKVF